MNSYGSGRGLSINIHSHLCTLRHTGYPGILSFIHNGRIMVKPVDDILKTAWPIGGAVDVPSTIIGKQIFPNWPWPEWIPPQQLDQS
jgi:hypothetical protein